MLSAVEVYPLKINNFSAKELERIFDKHIDENNNRFMERLFPLFKDYDIAQIKSNNGPNFIVFHTMVNKIKSWIRTSYSWVSDFNINRYLHAVCQNKIICW